MSTFLLNTKPETRSLYRRCATAMALVAAVFTLTVLVLLAANRIHADVAWPVDSPVLSGMIEKLHAGGGNADMAEQVRVLDLLTRRTYFFSVEFSRRGWILALFGFLFMLLGLQARASVSQRLPEPGKAGPLRSDLQSAAKARMLLAALSLLTLLLAGVVFLRFGNLPDFVPAEPRAAEVPATADTGGVLLPLLEGTWPGLRGPGGLGVTVVTNVPLQWNGVTGDRILWKTPLPLSGFNSPIVLKGRVFLTAGSRGSLSVLCIDANTGMLLKQVTVPSLLPLDQWPVISAETTYAASTMAADGDHVFAIFATGDIAGLTPDGDIRWNRNLGVPASSYGYASSLVADAGRVFVQYDCQDEQRLIALDAATGKTVWEKEREVMPSWASPVIIDVDGVRQVVVCAASFVAGYATADGVELWRTEGMGGEPAPSPAYADKMVYAASDYSVLMAIDVTRPELPVWRAIDDLPDVSSPLATDARLYTASSMGIVTCYHRRKGTVLWTQTFDQGFYSSPILVGGLIYLTDMRGSTFVFEDADAYRERAVSPLGEACMSTPAFIPGRIFLRGQSNLYCIGEP